MASTYRKNDTSEFIWLRYKDAAGKWRGKATAYRWANLGDQRQAKLLARRQSEIEASRGSDSTERLDAWAPAWLESRYGSSKTTTLDRYRRIWRTLARFLAEQGIQTAAQIRREFIERYLAWRARSAGRNSAISEIKLLAMILKESIARGHIQANPLAKPGLRKDATKQRQIWTNEDIIRCEAHLRKHGTRWMRCAFYFGLYQACRLRQCQIPIDAIRLDLGVIRYPSEIVKGNQAFAQPIDERFLPILRGLIDEARAASEAVICKVPWDASIRLRRSFDRAGLPGLSHHGLRTTWITRAADVGVSEAAAMAFAHHESREVHRIYKQLSAVATAHVPALLNLPNFGFGGAGDSPRTTSGNAPGSSPGRKGSRTRG